MNWFTKLPGFTRSPAGLERGVLRKLPRIALFGTLLIALPSVIVRALNWGDSSTVALTQITTVDIYVLGVVVLHWTVVFTVAIFSFIVYVMKGPAYVADAYQLQDSHKPTSP